MARHKLSELVVGGVDIRMHDGAFEKSPGGGFTGNDWSLPMQYAILQELKAISRKLNALECGNFLEIPRVLREIRRNTTKKKRPVGKPKLRVVA